MWTKFSRSACCCLSAGIPRTTSIKKGQIFVLHAFTETRELSFRNWRRCVVSHEANTKETWFSSKGKLLNDKSNKKKLNGKRVCQKPAVLTSCALRDAEPIRIDPGTNCKTELWKSSVGGPLRVDSSPTDAYIRILQNKLLYMSGSINLVELTIPLPRVLSWFYGLLPSRDNKALIYSRIKKYYSFVPRF